MPHRVLLINPNTTDAMTAKLAKAAQAALPECEIIAATGRFGAAYVASRVSFAIASHAALDCYAEMGGDCAAILLACFGDPGLEALREIAPVPVIGLIEASIAEAGAGGRRFSILTGGLRWQAMLEEALRARGIARQLASIRTLAPTGGQIAADPDGALSLLAQACREAIDQDGAQAVILGGAGLIGLAERLQPAFEVPILCSNAAGFRAVAAALSAAPLGAAQALPDPVPSRGLAPALERLLSGQGRAA